MGSWRVSGHAKATEIDSTEQNSRPSGSLVPWGGGGGRQSRGRRIKIIDSLFDEPKLVFDDGSCGQQRFMRYFSFGGVQKIRQHLSDNTVVRNRIVFVTINLLIIGYMGFSLLFG